MNKMNKMNKTNKPNEVYVTNMSVQPSAKPIIPRDQVLATMKSLVYSTDQWFITTKARTKLTNQLAAHVRRAKNKPIGEPVSEKEIQEVLTEPRYKMNALIIIDSLRRQLSDSLKEYENQMTRAVHELPIWDKWAKDICGVGEKTLAKILTMAVTQSGWETIGDYSNPAKLWKRFGLAVVFGERQRKVANDPDLAKIHGYSPKRRAEMYVLGEQFVRQSVSRRRYLKSLGFSDDEVNTKLKEDESSDDLGARMRMCREKSYYCGRYWQEKFRQQKLHPELTMIHVHRRAMRYATKLFLRDLWNKWRELHGDGEFHKSEDRW